MFNPNTLQLVGAGLFALALLHTFATGFFAKLAHRGQAHAGFWHLLAEVEVVFGFWAMVLFAYMAFALGKPAALAYLETRSFAEPIFVFVVMVIAASRPILWLVRQAVLGLVRRLPLPEAVAFVAVVLALLPLLGSVITEPAAMTVAALLLRERIFQQPLPEKMKYALLATLFVNVSIGGALTAFAAPPVLMVAGPWGWNNAFMAQQFGWKAAVAVMLNTAWVLAYYAKVLKALPKRVVAESNAPTAPIPMWIVLAHLGFLALAVAFGHYPAACVGVLLAFLGFTHAYKAHQSPLLLTEALLVAFFLAGLVVLGGLQEWWLKSVLMSLSPQAVFFGATALTAVTDNAALTYLGAQVSGLSPQFQYALLAGALAGGGLTVIANAPNPAGLAVLREQFAEQTVRAVPLFLAALPPTAVAVLCFLLL